LFGINQNYIFHWGKQLEIFGWGKKRRNTAFWVGKKEKREIQILIDRQQLISAFHAITVLI